ncbi:MAG TPA: glycine cleavage system protein GcvH [Micropepsaceae bacterium]|jgi:glycine cleavage system H protein|nr:glycine cleavage system protein GcvH [Micropepsaceae bacterium]
MDERFTESHEWIRADGGVATVGITKYAADQLGDVVFVELPEPGKSFASGAQIAVVESVKAASEIYAPVAGEVTESNSALTADPAKVNADPEGEAWFFKMRIADPASLGKLMTKDQYTDFVKGL